MSAAVEGVDLFESVTVLLESGAGLSQTLSHGDEGLDPLRVQHRSGPAKKLKLPEPVVEVLLAPFCLTNRPQSNKSCHARKNDERRHDVSATRTLGLFDRGFVGTDWGTSFRLGFGVEMSLRPKI